MQKNELGLRAHSIVLSLSFFFLSFPVFASVCLCALIVLFLLFPLLQYREHNRSTFKLQQLFLLFPPSHSFLLSISEMFLLFEGKGIFFTGNGFYWWCLGVIHGQQMCIYHVMCIPCAKTKMQMVSPRRECRSCHVGEGSGRNGVLATGDAHSTTNELLWKYTNAEWTTGVYEGFLQEETL